jgi:flagellar protein FlbD
VILVHRLRGEPMFLNPDLIEFIESTPDTVITLADGRKLVVADAPEEVIDRARMFRASVIVASDELRDSRHNAPNLTLLPGTSES